MPFQSNISNHGVVVGASATQDIKTITVGSTGQVLQGNVGADPSWSTATFPSTATTTGTILRADGTNWVATTSTYPNTNAVNTLLYASSANVMSALATANSGVLSTNSSGVPSIDTTNFQVLTTGLQLKGNNTNTAPPAGFIGEQIRSNATSASLTSTVAANITSISLTAGIWDVSALAQCQPSVSSTGINLGISTNSASFTGVVFGDSGIQNAPAASGLVSTSIPSFRVTLSSTTTYYLVVSIVFSGTATATGRISATRVG